MKEMNVKMGTIGNRVILIPLTAEDLYALGVNGKPVVDGGHMTEWGKLAHPVTGATTEVMGRVELPAGTIVAHGQYAGAPLTVNGVLYRVVDVSDLLCHITVTSED